MRDALGAFFFCRRLEAEDDDDEEAAEEEDRAGSSTVIAFAESLPPLWYGHVRRVWHDGEEFCEHCRRVEVGEHAAAHHPYA